MSHYNPCLIIVFNHKYDKNISVLEDLYLPHFQHIYFLVPFYTGTNPRVIPVYESSYYFQGYFAQGYKVFYRPEFTHYLFIGDDLILNPALNEHNYAELLGLTASASYVPELVPLHETSPVGKQTANPAALTQTYWSHTPKGIAFYENRKGSEAVKEMPLYDDALQCFAAHGIAIKPLNYYNVFGPLIMPTTLSEAIGTGKKLWTYYVSWRHMKVDGHSQQLQLEYPLARSYSDIVIVSAQSIERFCHFCGIFSAIGLFVEIAIPTALLLSSSQVLTDKDIKLKGEAIWLDDISKLELKYNLSLKKMLDDFPAHQLYYHPVKLSKWKRE